MNFDPVDLVPETTLRWQGDKSWGFSKSPGVVDPTIGGFGVLNQPISIGELVPYGPPAMYEVRFSIQLGAVLAPLVDEGLIKARLRYGVGAGNHEVDVDLAFGTSIVVPGGPVNVSVFQEGQFSRQIIGVSVGIAKFGAPRGIQPTCSYRIDGAAMAGPPMFRQGFQSIPNRARALLLHCRRSFGLYRIFGLSSAGVIVAEWDSGSDQALFGSGVPLPPNVLQIRVDYPFLANSPFLSFVLD